MLREVAASMAECQGRIGSATVRGMTKNDRRCATPNPVFLNR